MPRRISTSTGKNLVFQKVGRQRMSLQSLPFLGGISQFFTNRFSFLVWAFNRQAPFCKSPFCSKGQEGSAKRVLVGCASCQEKERSEDQSESPPMWITQIDFQDAWENIRTHWGKTLQRQNRDLEPQNCDLESQD